MRGTAYWIISVRNEAADAESAYPMPLAMSCLSFNTGGAWRQLSRHKHRAKGVLSGNSSEANRSRERREKVVKVALLSTLEVSTEMNRGTPSPPLWLTYKPTTGLSWKRERVDGSWSARQGRMLISAG
jgi:hypothetical protein